MALTGSSSNITQALERDATNLTVEKLKTVLRNSNLPVSGNKGVLVIRIKDELNRLSQSRNQEGFDRLRRMIQNPDRPPAPVSQSSASFGSPFASSSRFKGQNSGRSNVDVSLAPPFIRTELGSEMSFIESPFHVMMDKVSPEVDLDPREHSRDTTEFVFRLRGDVLDRIRLDRKLRILLFCATDDALRGPAHIAFPSSFEVKINGREVRANFRGLKNKPGTTRPVDVTDSLHQTSLQDNRVSATWALTTRKHRVVFYLVRQHDADDVVRKLREAKSISKASVLQEMNRWANDQEIVATSSRMSLKCPLSTLRIQTPIRSRRCRHNQCFDALSFFQLQLQAPQFLCPVCQQHIPFEILQVDEYVEDILKNSPPSIEQVTVDPDGHWSFIKDNGPSESTAALPVKREQTEFSDDIIEISGPITANSLGTPSSFSPFTNGTIRDSLAPSAASTPQSGPRKRPAPTVIDLTGSSDEDEDDLPIRPPAKRQNTGSIGGAGWPAGLGQAQSLQGYPQTRVGFPLPRPRGPLQSDLPFQ